MKAIVHDSKGDTPWMLRHEGVLSLNDLAFSLVACPSYASPTEFMHRWLMHFRECFWTAELQSAVLLSILREVIRPDHPISLAAVVDRIRLRDKSPAGKAAADRLESISLPYARLYESTSNRWLDLHEVSLYCPIVGAQTPATRFVTWLLIIERFAYLQHRQHRDRVHTVVFLDEAQTSLSRRQQTISGLPSTPVQLLPTTREHGMQFVVATPSWTELDPLVLSQFQVQIALQPSDGRELDAISKSFPLSQAQGRFTSGMQRGTGIGKVRGNQHPFVFTYRPFEQPKDIDEHTRVAARARAERFNALAHNSVVAQEGSAGQQAPPHTSAPAPAPLPTHTSALIDASAVTAPNTQQRVAPAEEPKTSSNSNQDAISPNATRNGLTAELTTSSNTGHEAVASNTQPRITRPGGKPRIAPHGSQEGVSSNPPRRVALNKHAAALLDDAAKHLLTPTTPAYERMDVHYTIGDRAKQLNIGLGLLEAHKVKIGASRGRTASILRLTPAGWAWLGRKPPRGTRGGDSVAHQYYVLELSRLIALSTIETLGADLVIPYNKEEHERLHRALESLSTTTIALNDGDLLALEVESSSPVVTGVRNAVKDVGFALTVIATFQQDIAPLQRRLPHDERVLIVDLLRLLDALRPTEAR